MYRCRRRDFWKGWPRAKIKQQDTDHRAHDDHRLQPDQAALVEIQLGQPAPPVIIGIGHDKARQHKKEVHGKIAMIDDLPLSGAAGIGLEQMKDDDKERCHAAQAIQNDIMVLADHGSVGVRGDSGNGHSPSGAFCGA